MRKSWAILDFGITVEIHIAFHCNIVIVVACANVWVEKLLHAKAHCSVAIHLVKVIDARALLESCATGKLCGEKKGQLGEDQITTSRVALTAVFIRTQVLDTVINNHKA